MTKILLNHDIEVFPRTAKWILDNGFGDLPEPQLRALVNLLQPPDLMQKLSATMVERAQALNLPKRQLNDATMHFFIGATAAFVHAGHPSSDHIGMVAAMILAPRGYDEVKRQAQGGA